MIRWRPASAPAHGSAIAVAIQCGDATCEFDLPNNPSAKLREPRGRREYDLGLRVRVVREWIHARRGLSPSSSSPQSTPSAGLPDPL
ncbi:MAG: hypothetical protein MUE68_11840 [Bacteroidetes bacterium]|nr:hypothetical protein [Bacteroidota bacterium]